jgi:hypothetical protein
MTNVEEQNLQYSADARANRLKEARKIGRISLRDITNNGVINYNTFCGWESGKHGGLTQKGALKVVEALNQLGVKCSIEWLLYGIGQKPISLHPMMIPRPLSSIKDFIPIHSDFIKQLYPEFIGIRIEDDAMSPKYNIGDFVSGMPLSQKKITQASGKDVIVQLRGETTIIRKLVINSKNNSASLISVNTSYHEPILTDVDIVQLALVLCHLRYDSLYEQEIGI